MKEYGISLLQFVLTGNKTLLSSFLENLSSDEHNRFISEFVQLENFFKSLTKTTFTDYSGLPSGVTADDMKKAYRKYELGKNVPEDGLLSLETYESVKSSVKTIEVLESSLLKDIEMTEQQRVFISAFAYKLYESYRFLGFSALGSFIDPSVEQAESILNINYKHTRAILRNYGKIKKFDLSVFKSTLARLSKILNFLDDLHLNDSSILRKDLKECIDVTSNLTTLFSLLELKQNFMTVREVAATLKILRDTAGLSGVDLHPSEFKNLTERLDRTKSESLDAEGQIHLKLIKRDIESALHYPIKGD